MYRICYFLFIANIAIAQTPGKISGLVTDDRAQKLDYITVSLLNAKDSALVKGTITNAQGKYQFDNVKPGDYKIMAYQVGYSKTYSPEFTIDPAHPEVVLGDIILNQDIKNLSEVTITTKKPLMERKADRLIVNVGNSILSAGNTGSEILEKMPGVLVDVNGNVSINGKAGAIVYIDGRPTNLSAGDLLLFLSGLNAGQIDRVEIISNPSSKYEASGNGIINIIVKKDQKIGLNGNMNLSYGQGVDSRYIGGFNLNYRDKKWNVFGGYNQTIINNFSDVSSERYFNSDGIVFDQQNHQLNKTVNDALRLGADFYATRKLTIGFLFNGILNNYSANTNNTTLTKSLSGITDSSLMTIDNNKNNWQNYTGNLNLRYAIDSTGRQLSFDLDYGNYHRNYNEFFQNSYFDQFGKLKQSPDTLINSYPGNLIIRSFKGDYSYPLRDKYKLETGIKASWVSNNNNLDFYNVLNGSNILDPGLSNDFVYKENINSAYADLSKDFTKISIQLGLRVEQTNSEGNELSTGQIFNRNYIDLFPSFFLSYKQSDDDQFNFSYSRRINRPSYQLLDPYKKIYDPFNYEEGNPYLNPELSHSFEISYLHKNTWNFDFSIDFTKGGINSIIQQNDNTHTTITTYGNISTVIDGGFGISYTKQVTSWWDTNDFIGEFFNYYHGPYLDGELNTFKPTFNLNATNSFILSEMWNAELNLNYLSGQQQGLLNIRSVGFQVNPGIQKYIFNKQGSIKLAVKDLLHTRKWQYSTQFENIDAEYLRRFDSRIAILSLNWRFGKKTVPPARKRATGAEEEKQRVQMDQNVNQ